MAKAFIIPSQLSEKQVEADVAQFFGFISSFPGELRLLDVDEPVTGADKKLSWQGTAYYLQFKVPCGLLPLTGAPPKQGSPHQQIRSFRRDNELDAYPYSLCFQLREPQDSSKPLQHNVLRKYELPPTSRAIYVCPLALAEADYVQSMQIEREYAFPIWEYRAQWVVSGQFLVRAAETSPFLRGHASIIPHADVTTWKHHYSFSRHATDIAFHEPSLVASGPSRLSDFVAAEVRRHAAAGWEMPTLDRLVESLRRVSASWWENAESRDQLDDDQGFNWIQRHGRVLRQRFGIRQFILLRDTSPSVEDADGDNLRE